MSINVTVSGNPVRISRGKMVTCDPTKTEFEKRRLMRLEQVRQQSKDIAKNIQNKFKKEKTKCLSGIEKEGEVKLKNWQARKLLELQNQYQEALDEIGLGHKEAARIEDEEADLVEREENNEKVAKERGRAAFERLQVEKNEKNLKKAAPIQRKKMTRDFENTRSTVVAKGKKDVTKKGREVFDSDGENQVPRLVGLSDSEESDDESESSGFEVVKKRTQVLKACKEQQTSPIEFQVPTSDKGLQTIAFEDVPKRSTTAEFFMDTRISDRIKRRTRLNPEQDYCDYVDNHVKGILCDCCKCPIRSQEVEKSSPEIEERHEMSRKSKTSKTSFTQHLEEPTEIGGPHKSKTSQTSFTQHIEEPTEIRVPNNSKASKTSVTQNLEEPIIPHRRDEPPDVLLRSKEPTTSGVPPKSKITKVDESAQQKSRIDKQKSEKPSLSQKTGSKTTKSDIPTKPKVTLRSVKDRPAYIGTDQSIQPVKFYDHPNRYSKLYIPKTSHIDKIDEEELQFSPNILSEEEIREKMLQRDKEAHLRGLAALEKEKLQREYKELLRKLPALQKQERICEIGLDKEKYHMSRDRLEELEKRRQNRLDNAYEELFVRRRPTVTLPRRKDDENKPQSLNLASWDTDFESSKDDRTQQLEDMLESLKSQKDSLLKEIENTFSKDALSKIADDGEVKSKSTDYTRTKTRRKRSRDESETLPTTSRKTTTLSTVTTATSPSPRKKPKLKKKKVTVLQNTSTQTTLSKAEVHSAATSPLLNSPATQSEVCTCPKTLDDMCEIVIKIKEDEKPEVLVNPPFLGKAVKVVTEDTSTEKEVPKKKEVPKEKVEPKKNGSWREHLSSTVSSKSSTSTSYRELPKKSLLKKPTPVDDVSRASTSSASTMKPLDPRLLTYIKKLLNMSRASIDDLTVSGVSEVSTPSPSLLETPSNNPLAQLRNVMKYFNIDAVELQKQLSYTTDESSKHYNTSETLTVSSSSEGERPEEFKSCIDIDPRRDAFQQYADVTASCTKKISHLTEMIEKVRAEKKKMLESSPSSTDSKELTTTSYKDLPDKRKSPTQEELDKQMLNIDYSYAEKLKQLTQDEIQSAKKRTEDDHELLTRLKKLLDDKTTTKKKVIINDEPVTLISEKTIVGESQGGKMSGVTTEKTTVNLSEESPPLFLDIPKLPRLETTLDKKKKKPPPSKGLRAITGNAPHELSTIVEADSQSKIESKNNSESDVPDILAEAQKKDKSPSNNSSEDVSEMETMETMLMSIGMEWAIPTLKKTREALALSSSSSSVSLREFLSKISSNSSKSDTSLNGSQGVSLIQADNRKTSTPIVDHGVKFGAPIFLTDSDLSSVKDHSKNASEEKFYDLNEGSLSKTG